SGLWQGGGLEGEGTGNHALEEQLGYGKEQLADLEALEWPTDKPRPPFPSHRGLSVTVELGENLTAKIKDLSRREGVTVFMTLLAALQTVLFRHSAHEDIAVGTDIANRDRLETERLIGFFIHQLF